jgi:hypothetical protein
VQPVRARQDRRVRHEVPARCGGTSRIAAWRSHRRGRAAATQPRARGVPSDGPARRARSAALSVVRWARGARSTPHAPRRCLEGGMRTHEQTGARARTHAQTHKYTHTHTHAHAHTRTRKHTHTHTHAHARTRTHAHTHRPVFLSTTSAQVIRPDSASSRTCTSEWAVVKAGLKWDQLRPKWDQCRPSVGSAQD